MSAIFPFDLSNFSCLPEPMTIDPQFSKETSKKDRNTSDDRKRNDRDNDSDTLAIDEGAERKKKKRKERRGREGAIDGALSSLSHPLCRGLTWMP